MKEKTNKEMMRGFILPETGANPPMPKVKTPRTEGGTIYRYQLGLANGESYIYDCKHSSIANLLIVSFNTDGWLYVGSKNKAVKISSVSSIIFVGEVK